MIVKLILICMLLSTVCYADEPEHKHFSIGYRSSDIKYTFNEHKNIWESELSSDEIYKELKIIQRDLGWAEVADFTLMWEIYRQIKEREGENI